jgi:hypothetical protein
MTDVKEIGDTYAMLAYTAQYIGRYAAAEADAGVCIERSRGVDSGSYIHGLTWRVAARFMLGNWDGALADQAELESLAAQDPRALPVAYTMRAYTFTSLCHELRGARDEADRYIELGRRFFESRRSPVQARGSVHLQPLALTLARRGRFEEALEMSPLIPRSAGAAVTLEVLCELTAAQERWEDASALVAAAREEAENGELLAVPLHAHRLEGRAAAAAGDAQRAATLLRRSAEGFAALQARWEEAWSRLLLAEALAEIQPRDAGRELEAALAVFTRLGSVREVERARRLLASVAV